MSNPIKSASTPNASTGAQAASGSLPADWLAKLGAERASDGNGANSFARWMSQHTQPAQSQITPATTNTPSASPKPASTMQSAAPSATPTSPAAKGGPGWTTAQARLAAQRSLSSPPSQGAGATSASQTPAKAARANASQHTSSTEATEQARNSQDTQRAHGAKASKEAKEAKGTQQGSVTDGVEDADAVEGKGQGDKDEVKYTTALGDGTAIVRELTPPPGIQANDPAGMMAWLAHLTQSGGDGATAAHGSDKGSEASGQEASSDAAGLSLGQVDDGRGSSRGRGAGVGLSALSMAPDASGKSTGKGAAGDVRSDIALQTEALMARGSDREAVDPAALLASDGARIASFGQTLSEVRQALPHAQATLPTPLDAPDFSQKLADQVSLWVGQARNDGTMTAELHLNPAEMGPINVKISLDGQTAHVDFAAAALETRQAIQASLSMLSSSLTDVGLSLSGGGVFSQTSQQQAFAQGAGSGGGNGQQRGRSDGSASDDDALSLRQVSAPRSNRLGGLDLYA